MYRAAGSRKWLPGLGETRSFRSAILPDEPPRAHRAASRFRVSGKGAKKIRPAGLRLCEHADVKADNDTPTIIWSAIIRLDRFNLGARHERGDDGFALINDGSL